MASTLTIITFPEDGKRTGGVWEARTAPTAAEGISPRRRAGGPEDAVSDAILVEERAVAADDATASAGVERAATEVIPARTDAPSPSSMSCSCKRGSASGRGSMRFAASMVEAFMLARWDSGEESWGRVASSACCARKVSSRCCCEESKVGEMAAALGRAPTRSQRAALRCPLSPLFFVELEDS